MVLPSNDSKSARGVTAKAGLPPGSLIYVGHEHDFATSIEAIEFNTEFFKRTKSENIKEIAHVEADTTLWMSVFGLHDVDLIETIGQRFHLHHLLLEDVLNTAQRPTADLYDDTFFMSMKMVYWDDAAKSVRSEHISAVLQAQLVVLFQEKPGDIFDELRSRIENGKGVIKSRGADYLYYRIMDTAVDQYFVIMEKLHQRVERIEADILKKPEQRQMARLISLKKQILQLRGTIVPLRDHLTLLERVDRSILKKETLPYLRDLSAHVKEVIDSIDLERETIMGLIDLYLSASGQQMNNVMKVLTVISTIFIPLTFIVGIYGMNFDHMPELHHPYAYPIIWGIMIGLTGGLLLLFRKKGWL
jgi:magnesium transporter